MKQRIISDGKQLVLLHMEKEFNRVTIFNKLDGVFFDNGTIQINKKTILEDFGIQLMYNSKNVMKISVVSEKKSKLNSNKSLIKVIKRGYIQEDTTKKKVKIKLNDNMKKMILGVLNE